MRPTRQKQGKTTEDVPAKCIELTNGGGIKKLENRSCIRRRKATGGKDCPRNIEDSGVSYLSTAQPLVKSLQCTENFAHGTTRMPLMELKTGKPHPSGKIKLQLFPVDESTRRGLEKDGCNPFLELTLSARKKVSSVLNHLNTKWGYSSVALGDLMLFPFNVKLENLVTSQKWISNDSGINVGDVYEALKSPALFRLRYGWFPNQKPETCELPSTSTPMEAGRESEVLREGCSAFSEINCKQRKTENLKDDEFGRPMAINRTPEANASEKLPLDASADRLEDESKTDNGPATEFLVPWDYNLTNLSIGGLLSEASLQGRTNICDPKSNIELFSDISIGGLFSEASLHAKINNSDLTSNSDDVGLQMTVDKGIAQSQYPWDDNLTNLSIGGLLSEASLQAKINHCDSEENGSKPGMESFAACVDGQKPHPLLQKPMVHESHSSILDAEETCHAFSFRKFSSAGGRASFRGCDNDESSVSFRTPNKVMFNNEVGRAQVPGQGSLVDFSSPSRGILNEESSLGLTGIKWDDSLNPFNFEMATSRRTTNGDSGEFVR